MRIVNTRGTVARTLMEFFVFLTLVVLIGPFIESLKWYFIGLIIGTIGCTVDYFWWRRR